MSVITAQKFLERVEREETLRAQMYVSGVNSLELLVQFAHGKGFVLTTDEMRQALESFKPKLKTANLEQLKQLASPQS